jgi:hypothetical protein
MSGTNRESLISKVVSKEALDANAFALRAYGYYRKTSDLIERANYALGRKSAFKANTGSTLNFEVNLGAAHSTTTQKI